jgi:glutamate synthase (NADPH/NADH) small chain
VIDALDYLIASNRKSFGDAVPAFDSGALDAAGKRVVVVGGGDTAMDCVRTAVRQGATSVTCLYRRDRANMPGSQREVANAEEEGVTFVWLSAPEAFEANAEGQVTAVRATRMRLGAPDASGRRAPEPDADGGFRLEADLVVKALGFDPEELPTMFGVPELGVTRWGTLRIDHKSMMTSLDGVFAAGDIVRGASLVVWAIRDGRDVAEKMHAWLKARSKVAALATEAVAA